MTPAPLMVVELELDFKQLFEYNRMVRLSFLDTMSRLSWEEVVKNREASFYSIRNIYLHTLDVEEFLIHHLIPGRLAQQDRRDFDDFKDIGSMKARTLETDETTAKIIETVTAGNLVETVEFPLGNRPSLRMTVEDVLIQDLTEQIHHRGELIALLWQMNIEPPEMEWLWYLEQANEGRAQHRQRWKQSGMFGGITPGH